METKSKVTKTVSRDVTRRLQMVLAVLVTFTGLNLHQCRKRLSPTIFHSIGEISHSEQTFSTDDGIMVISVPNHLGKCLIKLYPKSSVVISDSFIMSSVPTIKLSSPRGLIFLHSENCKFEIDDEIRCNNCQLFLKVRDKVQVEVIEGKVHYKELSLRRSQGYIPSSLHMYSLKPKINLVFPRNGQELIIPFFLWEKKEEVETYLLEFSTDPEFINTILYVYVQDNKFFPNKMRLRVFSKRLFWRVIYEDKNGIGGIPSDPYEFIIP